MKGSKGQFMPLKQYCVDFENKLLIKGDSKRIKEAVRKNETKYKQLLEKVNQLLRY